MTTMNALDSAELIGETIGRAIARDLVVRGGAAAPKRRRKRAAPARSPVPALPAPGEVRDEQGRPEFLERDDAFEWCELRWGLR